MTFHYSPYFIHVYHFHLETLEALRELLQAAGLHHPRDITPHHIVRRGSDNTVASLAHSLNAELPEGALLSGDLSGLPHIYQRHWPRAQAQSFAPLTA